MRVNGGASFVYLAYPIVCDSDHFAERIAALAAAESKGSEGASLPVWCKDKFPEDDLLTQVARYLNPADDRVPTARLWRLDPAQRHQFGAGGTADWCLNRKRGCVPFRVGPERGVGFAAQMALFQDGVGFLTLRADPVSTELRDWLDFVHYARFVGGQRGVHVELQRRTKEPDRQATRMEPFFPAVAGGTAAHADGCGTLSDLLDALLMTGCLAGEGKPWWREIFVPGQAIPFVGLFVEDASEEEIAELRYRLRNLFHAEQEIHPTEEDLRADHPSLLPYAEGQWFTFSLDGGAFLACDAPNTPFFRDTLPDHLRTSYFLLFLLALHQRFGLMMLSEQVAEHWLACGDEACEARREEAFRRIRDSLFSFTARAHFLQVMQREHHHRCYRKWLDVLEVADLYREVRDEVQDMHDYLMMRQAEKRLALQREEQGRIAEQEKREARRERDAHERAGRLERLLTAIAAVLGVPTLALAFLQATGGAGLVTAGVVTLASMAVGGLLYLGVRRVVGRAK